MVKPRLFLSAAVLAAAAGVVAAVAVAVHARHAERNWNAHQQA